MTSNALTIPSAASLAVEERKVRNAIAQQIRGATWAKDIDERTIRAVAEYAYRHGIDPVTEVEVLGGRIYKTSTYYERKGAELIAAGVLTRVEKDNITHDERGAALYATCMEWAREAEAAGDPEEAAKLRRAANDARRETIRRQMERIRWGAPDHAAAVVVVRLYVNGLDAPVEGCQWAGPGLRMKKAKEGREYEGDPIGAAEPAKTAETRAARRAWKQLVTGEGIASASPALARIAAAERTADDDTGAVLEVFEEQRALAEAQRPALPGPQIVGDYTEPGIAEPRARGHDAPTIVTRALPASPTMQALADEPSAYGEDAA